MVGLFKRRESRRLERERIQRLEQESINTIFLSIGPYYLRTPRPQPPRFIYTLTAGFLDGIDFPPIALEIMAEILHGCAVVTWIESTESSRCFHRPKKKCRHFISMPRRYYSFLQYHGLAGGAFLSDDSRELITVGQGLDMPLMRALMGENLWEHPHDVYARTSLPFAAESFEQIKSRLADESCLLRMRLFEDPDYLDLCVDRDRVDMAGLAGAIRRVCDRHGKKLELDLEA